MSTSKSKSWIKRSANASIVLDEIFANGKSSTRSPKGFSSWGFVSVFFGEVDLSTSVITPIRSIQDDLAPQIFLKNMTEEQS